MDRDLDKEKIIEKMRSLRDKRDLEILNQDLEEVNLDSDYQKELPENKVLNIKYLGKIEINNEPKDIYLVLEQKQKDDGNKIEIERYCTEDGEVLGGNNNSDQFNFITPNEIIEIYNRMDKIKEDYLYDNTPGNELSDEIVIWMYEIMKLRKKLIEMKEESL